MGETFDLFSNDPASVAMRHSEQFRPDFISWLRENGHVFSEVERRALQVASYRNHYSMRTIFETVRHDTVIGELRGEWKINNNAAPDCARLFALLHPKHAGLFEFREHKAAA
jgi:hypothetical protein